MKFSRLLLVSLAICLTAGSISGNPRQASAATGYSVTTPSWPRVFDRNGTHVVVYQPQLKDWQKYRTLIADTAISITDPGQKTVLGVISWRAETITDQSAQTVYVSNIVVLDARFPSLDAAQAAAIQKRVHQIYPTMTLTIGLPRMIASLQHVNVPVRSVTGGTQPPTILVSTSPAIVLLVDGKPVLAPIQGTTLQYVVNTNWDLFYDNSDYYLLNGRVWLEAKVVEAADPDHFVRRVHRIVHGSAWDGHKLRRPRIGDSYRGFSSGTVYDCRRRYLCQQHGVASLLGPGHGNQNSRIDLPRWNHGEVAREAVSSISPGPRQARSTEPPPRDQDIDLIIGLMHKHFAVGIGRICKTRAGDLRISRLTPEDD